MAKLKLGVFLTPEVHGKLRVAAAKENLSMTKKAELMIIEALARKKVKESK